MTRKTLTQLELDLIQKNLSSRDHKRLFPIARYTGQKLGAICSLKVSDVYTRNKQPLAEISFSGIKSGDHNSIVFDKLELELIRYIPENFTHNAWLFPSRIKEGRHITFNTIAKSLKVASKKAGLDHSQISTNTIRQSFISHLYELGFNKNLIREIVGLNKFSPLPIDTSNEPTKINEMLEKIFS